MIDQVEEDNGESTIILEKALYKGFIASGVSIRPRGSVLFTVADKDKVEATDLAKRFFNIGYHVLATAGTAAAFKQVGIPVKVVNKIGSEEENLLEVTKGSG